MSTLQFFGIPTGGGSGRGGILMPKVKNRFRVIVTNFGTPTGSIALTQQVVTVGRPHVQFEPVAVHSYNSIAYFAGKASWETIALTVRDDVTNSVSALIGAQAQKQMNFFDQTVPMAAAEFKFGMEIDAMDGGDDTVLESWTMEGCFLSDINWGSNDYSSSDAMTIEMTVRCDNMTQNNGLMPIDPILLSSPFAT
jgi:hypothetical protein